MYTVYRIPLYHKSKAEVAFPLTGMHFAREGASNRAVRWWIAYWLLETLFTSFQQVSRGESNLRVLAVYGLQWLALARLWCWLHVQQASAASRWPKMAKSH